MCQNLLVQELLGYTAMLPNEDTCVERSRALITETERNRIAGNGDKDELYQSVSRVRHRIHAELSVDVALLKTNHEELYEELVKVVNNA